MRYFERVSIFHTYNYQTLANRMNCLTHPIGHSCCLFFTNRMNTTQSCRYGRQSCGAPFPTQHDKPQEKLVKNPPITTIISIIKYTKQKRQNIFNYPLLWPNVLNNLLIYSQICISFPSPLHANLCMNTQTTNTHQHKQAYYYGIVPYEFTILPNGPTAVPHRNWEL